MTYRMLKQKSREWLINLWVATIDFAKAFDTVHHESIWKSLSRYGISEPYICLLKKQYSKKRVMVARDTESDEFPIARWSRHGYLLSSLLFNSVLQFALEDDLRA